MTKRHAVRGNLPLGERALGQLLGDQVEAAGYASTSYPTHVDKQEFCVTGASFSPVHDD